MPAVVGQRASWKAIDPESMPSILNLGCGDKRMSGALNVDVNPRVRPEVIHDLNEFPWPLPDSQFETVVMADSIEHLKDVVLTMEELHRVCKDGALVKITTPHLSCSNSFTDPTHIHHLGFFSFHFFTGESGFVSLSEKRFRRRNIQIIFRPNLINRIVWRLANRYPRAYEVRWAWLFPAWFLNVELEVVK
jgi:hypothetical protein